MSSSIEFQLRQHADSLPEALPLGMRQRLSLAVAVVHRPEMLILDEPTSGVDPIARDDFWRLLIDLSRQHGVTIFVSTHFMNEGERCDRISSDARRPGVGERYPRGADSEPRRGELGRCVYQLPGGGRAARPKTPAHHKMRRSRKNLPSTHAQPDPLHSDSTIIFSFRRLLAYARRESLELWRDPIRLTFAILGSVILMLILGYGISLDVEDLRFAVLDRDQTPQSRDYIQNIAASRYFIERPALADVTELDRRMRSGEVSVAIEIPSPFRRRSQARTHG